MSQVKYRSQVKLSKEFLKSYLGIPEGIEIIYMHYDSIKEVLQIILGSDTLQQGVYEITEGMEIPMADPKEWLIHAINERARIASNNENAAELLREEVE